MEGRILVLNVGSTSLKVAFYDSEARVFEKNIPVPEDVLKRQSSIMDLEGEIRNQVFECLASEGIPLETIDIVMARGGLISPVITGVYEVNQAMKDVLRSGIFGVHACNLSALVADYVAEKINASKVQAGLPQTSKAYIADPPMADEMWSELKVGGLPEFHRRSVFHALNSRAVVRRYAKSVGKTTEEVTVIVAHIGGGSSVSVYHHGKVIDVTDSLGGDGPITPERAGTVPGFPIVDMCFSGEYTKDEVKKKLVGNGGAMAFFGTKDFKVLAQRANNGDECVDRFLRAYCISVAKYIGYFSTVVCGEVDAIIITGGIAYNESIVKEISRRVSFIAPVVAYPGENEMEALAENGYKVLSGEFKVHIYNPEGIVD